MDNKWKILIAVIVFAVIASFFVIPTTRTDGTGEQGQDIISAEEALNLITEDNVALVDTQSSSDYSKEHVKGSVNISRNEITVLGPYPNMLADQEKIEKVLGESGISNNTTVIAYDNNNNMDAARLWWTMKVYGHQDVKVVSGGKQALVKAGADLTDQTNQIVATTYNAEQKNTDMIATKDDVKQQVNNPSEDTVILDVRTIEEINMGTIPGSICINYVENNYADGTFRPIKNIHLIYREAGIDPRKSIIMFCKTSIRAAQTYVALHNAGYRNLKLYDGAWVEWSSDGSLPVQMPENQEIEMNFQDAS